MSKEIIDKKEFYDKLISMFEHAKESIHFYSISCCWGFYSRGLQNFENVLLSLEKKIGKKIGRKYLDIKIIVKSDKDNAIDKYAIERMAYLEAEYKDKTGLRDKPRIIFKEFEEYEHETFLDVQFVIIDNKQILISKSQESDFNKILDLDLNKSESGSFFELEDDKDEFLYYKSVFNKNWETCRQLNVDIQEITKRHLKFILSRFRLTGVEKTEREFQVSLGSYLQNVQKLTIKYETPFDERRVDISVGTGAIQTQQAIEIKFEPGNNDVKEIIGQITIYKNQFDNLFLVIAKPKYSDESRHQLISVVKDKNIELIEIE